MAIELTPITSSVTYTSIEFLIQRWGETNIVKWSNVENDDASQPDVDRVNDAIVWAEDFIDAVFLPWGYEVPFAVPVPTVVRGWANDLAGYRLYTARGLRDEDEANKLRAIFDAAKRDMALHAAGARGGLGQNPRKSPVQG